MQKLLSLFVGLHFCCSLLYLTNRYDQIDTFLTTFYAIIHSNVSLHGFAENNWINNTRFSPRLGNSTEHPSWEAVSTFNFRKLRFRSCLSAIFLPIVHLMKSLRFSSRTEQRWSETVIISHSDCFDCWGQKTRQHINFRWFLVIKFIYTSFRWLMLKVAGVKGLGLFESRMIKDFHIWITLSEVWMTQPTKEEQFMWNSGGLSPWTFT